MLFALLAIPALPTGRGPIFAPATTPDAPFAAAKQFVADEIPDPCGPCAPGLCTGDRTLAEAQAEGCTEVTGDLTDGGASGDVNLPSLRYVRGGILLENNANLNSLTMDNLERVGGYRGMLPSYAIFLENNNLASLTMNNLKRADGAIGVQYNNNLASLTMNNLEFVRGNIWVLYNDNLASLAMPDLRYGGIIEVDLPEGATCDLGDLTNLC